MAGFNGILGVGLWTQDCGKDCDPAYSSAAATNGMYFNGSTAAGIGVPLANQVVNRHVGIESLAIWKRPAQIDALGI